MSSIDLSVTDLFCSYPAREVLKGLTFSISRGEVTGVIGPNGSGKSTLLKTISKVLRPSQGEILLQGRNIARMNQRQVAHRIAVVDQDEQLGTGFKVWEVVLMGRYPYLSRLQREKAHDWNIVRWAMQATGTLDLRDRMASELSGGEKQRVLLARALAQEPDILLLDEPTSHLDIAHQTEILDLVEGLRKDNQLTVLMVLHDLNLAAQYCDSLILMKDGRVFAEGFPGDVITVHNIMEVYGSRVMLTKHPINSRPHVILTPGSPVLGEPSKEGQHMKSGKFVLITGGVRSGKSRLAEEMTKTMASEVLGRPVIYIATAEAGDDEMRERIERHRQQRPREWTTIEEQFDVASVINEQGGHSNVILVDCMTLLVSNWLIRAGGGDNEWSPEKFGEKETQSVLQQAADLAAAAHNARSNVIFVTNEVGWGLVPDNPLGRAYRDVLGLCNQIMAAQADEVYAVWAGIPLKIKG